MSKVGYFLIGNALYIIYRILFLAQTICPISTWQKVTPLAQDAGLATECWLITDYHQRGSLFEYLSKNDNSVLEALVLAHSAIAGINHLHREINGVQATRIQH